MIIAKKLIKNPEGMFLFAFMLSFAVCLLTASTRESPSRLKKDNKIVKRKRVVFKTERSAFFHFQPNFIVFSKFYFHFDFAML